MELIKKDEIELFKRATEAIKEINPKIIVSIHVLDLNEDNLDKEIIDNINIFKVKDKNWLWDVICKIHLDCSENLSAEYYKIIRVKLFWIITVYFLDFRWDLTNKMKKLLTKKNKLIQ